MQILTNFTDLFRLQRPRVDEETDEHLRYLHGRDQHGDRAGHAPSADRFGMWDWERILEVRGQRSFGPATTRAKKISHICIHLTNVFMSSTSPLTPLSTIWEFYPMTSLALPQVRTINLPQCPAGIIGVHDGVDDVVHDDEPPRAGSVLGPAEEGIHEHGHVVVPVARNDIRFERSRLNKS